MAGENIIILATSERHSVYPFLKLFSSVSNEPIKPCTAEGELLAFIGYLVINQSC